jgi:hypothetical protein
MPSLHHLNPPPHPFWDFVANIEDHPFFAAYGGPPHYASREDVNNNSQQPQQAEATQPTAEGSETAKSKQPSVEDPPEVDPSTVKPEVLVGALLPAWAILLAHHHLGLACLDLPGLADNMGRLTTTPITNTMDRIPLKANAIGARDGAAGMAPVDQASISASS